MIVLLFRVRFSYLFKYNIIFLVFVFEFFKDVPKGAKKYQKFWTVEIRPVMDQGYRRK